MHGSNVEPPAAPDPPLRPIARAQDQLFAAGTSSREKYAALVVGRRGLPALLKHEPRTTTLDPSEVDTIQQWIRQNNPTLDQIESRVDAKR